LVVCSDSKAGAQAEDITTHDIPLPTTDAARLSANLAGVGRRLRGMTVVFSTYQSIQVVADAQQASGQPFDLILCDEAHRTTGVTLSGDSSESAFVKVHDNSFLPAGKRLYMTATPRIYGDAVKKKADEASAVLTSMDDETVFGPEFHRLGFGEAVERNLLSDYKVMVLVVPGDAISETFQTSLAGDNPELALDDAAKIVGCWNGLAKRTADGDFGPNQVPMKRAVAFSESIKASQGFARAFPQVVETITDPDNHLACDVHHVDGTMNALARAEELAWLKAYVPEGECRVLTNARCLSEGVDVPALDAVLFLHPRNSLVDVVQSVGRVMRKAKDKQYGYVILPVAIPAGLAPEDALKDNKRFRVVWDVLNALRSHDDRFNAMINSIDLDKNTRGKIIVDVFGNRGPIDDPDGKVKKPGDSGTQLPLFTLQEWKDSILARIVKKVGDREYWEQWTDDVVDIHTNQTARIKTILAHADPAMTAEFDAFHQGLKDNLNDSITLDNAVDMLSQHLLTKPVFEALFPHDSFAAHNPVSITMQRIVDALAGHGLDAETAKLDKFYASVRLRAEGITTPAGRQAVVHDLYENFFKDAFPKQSSSLGVVYTPVEIVDFILRAADDVCRHEFGYGLTDPGVHVLDPFAGTGTFIVRLLQSGIIRPEDLARKYAGELWANEIMLLAYYIACVNIETTYLALRQEHTPDAQIAYEPFPGATLTDTFQITEEGDRADTSLIPVNNDRINAQLAAPIRVIVGNPPYSGGQDSANDDNANLKYPSLDQRIRDTYTADRKRGGGQSAFDSYIRAFRWASDRIGDHGVVAFVSNNGWLDGNSSDGIRKNFASEFSDIWVYNLRGNSLTAGEPSKREGGNPFPIRVGVAVLVAAKRAGVTGCRLHYYGVPDYQGREEKLATLAASSLMSVPWQQITPNSSGDWLSQRSDAFLAFTPMGTKDSSAPTDQTLIFRSYSRGLETGRDAWIYNYSEPRLRAGLAKTIDAYNRQVEQFAMVTNSQPTVKPKTLVDGFVDLDATKISWTLSLKSRLAALRAVEFVEDGIRPAVYRPFSKQNCYFDRALNHIVGRLPSMFPTAHHSNLGIAVSDAASAAPFSCLAFDALPNLVVTAGAGNPAQFFPRWTYEQADETQGSLLGGSDSEVDEWGYRRVDNITDAVLAVYQRAFGDQVTKDDVFFYVYGVLHSPQYRTTFAADLKRMLPRVPIAATRDDFEAFVVAGRKLSALHVGYETVEPYPLHEQTPFTADPWETFKVTKMRWADKTNKRTLIVNEHVTLGDIPDAAHRYMLGSRSAVEWLIDRYQYKVDKDSGIVNDPNDWGREHGDPRYIVDLVKRIVRVSVDTMKIVDSLPSLPLG